MTSPVKAASSPTPSLFSFTEHRPLLMYGLAFVLNSFLYFLQPSLAIPFGERPMLVLFMLPIIICALLGGLSPGLVATALAAAYSALLIAASHKLAIIDNHDLLQWGVLLFNGVLISLVSGEQHKSRQRETAKWQELAATEAQLQQSEYLFHATFNYAAVGMALIGAGGRWLRVNRKLCDILGYSPEELLDKTCPELTHPDDRQADLHQVQLLLNKEIATFSLEKRYFHKDGHIVWVNFSVTLASQTAAAKHCIAVIADISKRKHAQMLLSQSEAMKQAILDSVTANIAVIDQQGKIIAVNQPWQRFSELNRLITGEMPSNCSVGASYLEVCQHCAGTNCEDALAAAEGIQALLNGQLDSFRLEYPCHSPTQQRWFLMIATPLGSAGKGSVIVHTDITPRKLAEIALHQLKEDLSATLQAVPDLLLEIDQAGCCVKVKASKESVLIVQPTLLLGRTVQETLPPEAAQTMLAALKAASQTGSDYGRTITLPFPTGERCFELSLARKTDANEHPQHFIVLSRDITERKTAETAMRQQAQVLATSNAELHRFNRAMIGRELNLIELKKEVNALAAELGRQPPYPLAFLNDVTVQNQQS